jgi:hypothetical protein
MRLAAIVAIIGRCLVARLSADYLSGAIAVKVHLICRVCHTFDAGFHARIKLPALPHPIA